MKISYISGVKGRANSMQSESNLIGSLGWADRAGVKLSLAQKAEIRVKQFNPLISTARGIVRELISGNRGGLADMIYGMSPFNTQGKIDPSLKAQHEAALKEAKTIANQKFPLSYNKIDTSKLPPGTFFAEDVQKSELTVIRDENYKKHLQYMQEAEKAANKKFPYLIYPPSNDTARRKYREIEIMWLNYGGNVDTFNAAVKEGVTKSPRNKTFNYLLGKFAAKRYFPKDLGLAIRAVVGSALGGDRFSWTDKDIFNPWLKKYGSGSISGIQGPPPDGGASAVAATTAAAPWWVPILTKLCYALIAMLPLLFNSWNSDSNNPPAQVGGDLSTFQGQSDRSNLTQYLLPIGAAVAGYLLFFSDDKKD
jgi:hypothetical protein